MKAIFIIIAILICTFQDVICKCAENIHSNSYLIDFSEKPKVINIFELDLYIIKESRIKEIIDLGINQLNIDSISGDYFEVTVCDCNHGTIVKIEKKDWSLQTDDYSSILGYSRYKSNILIVKDSSTSCFFRKSKIHRPIRVCQFEPTDLADYNPPLFLLPCSKYVRITSWGQLVPTIKLIK